MWKQLPFMVFGITGIIGAASALIFSETLNQNMPQDVQEAEELSTLK